MGRRAIIPPQGKVIPQGLSLVKDIALFQMVQDNGDIVIGERQPVMCLKLGLKVRGKCRAVGDCDCLSAQPFEVFDKSSFKLGYGLNGK